MIKQAIQSFLRFLNIKVTRIPSHVMPTMPFDLLEHVVAKVLHETGPSFRFIQVGANDGVISGNLTSLIRKYKITGCLVEHKPEILERLKLNYQDQSQIMFSSAIIGYRNETEVVEKFESGSFMPADCFRGLERQDSQYNRIRTTEVDLTDQVEKFDCTVCTLKSLFDVLGYEYLHLLYIETEGSEDKIIYQALDAKLHPAIINYVRTKMGLEQNYELKMRLLDEGYRFIDVGADTICVRQPI